jgi:hypothetical protein
MTKFKFEVSVNTSDPTDSRLHSLIRDLPKGMAMATSRVPAAMSLSGDSSQEPPMTESRRNELGLPASEFKEYMLADRRQELGIE